MAYAFKTIRTNIENRVLYATIDNSPINLVDPPFVRDLVGLLDELDHDAQVRVVVFRSADPDFFIPHVDLLQIPEYTAEAARSGGPDDINLGALYRRLSEARQVTITVLEGRARGAGNEFALATDMRFASRERAIVGQPEAGFGVFPGAGAIQHIARLAGRGNAMQVLLASDDWSADEAERIGLVNRSLPDSELMPYVTALAERIASLPEGSVRLVKRRVNAVTLPPKEDMQVDGGMFALLAKDPEVGKLMKYLMSRGLQTRSRTELELADVLMDYFDREGAE